MDKVRGSVEAKFCIEEIKDVVKYIEMYLTNDKVEFINIFDIACDWNGASLEEFIRTHNKETGNRVRNAIDPYIEYLEGFFKGNLNEIKELRQKAEELDKIKKEIKHGIAYMLKKLGDEE